MVELLVVARGLNDQVEGGVLYGKIDGSVRLQRERLHMMQILCWLLAKREEKSSERNKRRQMGDET